MSCLFDLGTQLKRHLKNVNYFYYQYHPFFHNAEEVLSTVAEYQGRGEFTSRLFVL